MNKRDQVKSLFPDEQERSVLFHSSKLFANLPDKQNLIMMYGILFPLLEIQTPKVYVTDFDLVDCAVQGSVYYSLKESHMFYHIRSIMSNLGVQPKIIEDVKGLLQDWIGFVTSTITKRVVIQMLDMDNEEYVKRHLNHKYLQALYSSYFDSITLEKEKHIGKVFTDDILANPFLDPDRFLDEIKLKRGRFVTYEEPQNSTYPDYIDNIKSVLKTYRGTPELHDFSKVYRYFDSKWNELHPIQLI